MKIHKFYKDVTYETLKNKDFAERVMKVIPQSVLEGSLLREEVAAKAGAATLEVVTQALRSRGT